MRKQTIKIVTFSIGFYQIITYLSCSQLRTISYKKEYDSFICQYNLNHSYLSLSVKKRYWLGGSDAYHEGHWKCNIDYTNVGYKGWGRVNQIMLVGSKIAWKYIISTTGGMMKYAMQNYNTFVKVQR